MIHPIQRTDIVAIENHFALQLIPVLLDMVVLDHNDHHIHFVKEMVEVENLALYNLLASEEWVESLERASQMSFLDVEQLDGRALSDVIHTVGSHHQCCGQTNIAKSNDVYHIILSLQSSFSIYMTIDV